MERPTDSFKETHNITISEEDTLFGGLVSNLQVAELMAVIAKNRSLSYCKVVEVVAETTAPLTPMEDLLAKIPPQRVEVSPPKETGDLQKSATPSSITSEIPDASLEKKPAETKLKAAAPLSPYTAYADLKPPTSPSPIPPCGRQQGTSGAEDSKPTKEASSVVDYAFDKAELLTTRPSSPYAAYEDLKPPTSPSPNPPGGRQEGASGAEDSKPTKPASSAVDSTFDKAELLTTSYEDLKPPTSPSTNTPGGRQEGASGAENSKPTKEASSVYLFTFEKAELLTTRPLSPYTDYEDLKPPTSPSPRPSGSKSSATVEVTSPVTGGNDVAIDSATNSAKEDSSKYSAFCHSPYPAYEDLKPPSSPTPSFNKM
ncbi:hypothetical protein AABB24_017264 [Solanum stoloniferum]